MPKTRSMNFNNQEDEIIATAFTVQGNNAPAGTSQDGVQGPLIPRVLTLAILNFILLTLHH